MPTLLEFFMPEAWYDKKDKKDPATEFLKSKGFDAKGQPMGPQSTNTGNQTFSRPTSGTRPQAGTSTLQKVPDEVKPKWKGTMVGQTVQMGQRRVPKPVSWQDRETGERRRATVQGWDKDHLVWDGEDWVTPAMFKAKFPGNK